MDIAIQQLIDAKKANLTKLMNQAIGGEFKERVSIAIKLTEQSGALYYRMQRTLGVMANEADMKRVKAGRLTVDDINVSGRTSAPDKIFGSYHKVMQAGTTSLPSSSQSTPDRVAVASKGPQAINLLALLQNNILKSDPMGKWHNIVKAAELLGVAATTIGFATTGILGAGAGYVSAAATYSGYLNRSAPDFPTEAIKNYIACVATWNQKAGNLLEVVDPGGQWTFNDFH